MSHSVLPTHKEKLELRIGRIKRLVKEADDADRLLPASVFRHIREIMTNRNQSKTTRWDIRRLLEQVLGHPKYTLDAIKSTVDALVDYELQMTDPEAMVDHACDKSDYDDTCREVTLPSTEDLLPTNICMYIKRILAENDLSKITRRDVRRLLEQTLGQDKYALDKVKPTINTMVDNVLQKNFEEYNPVSDISNCNLVKASLDKETPVHRSDHSNLQLVERCYPDHSFKVVRLPHMGLKLRRNLVYTYTDLMSRCNGNHSKKRRLHELLNSHTHFEQSGRHLHRP